MSDWKNKKLNHMNNPDMSFTTLMQSYREIQITYDAPHAKPGFFCQEGGSDKNNLS